MKKPISYLLFILILAGYRNQPQNKDNFSVGESYTYLCRMGFLNAAKATVVMDTQTYEVKGKSCLKVEVKAWTVKPVGYFYNVLDEWISYMDQDDLKPYISSSVK